MILQIPHGSLSFFLLFFYGQILWYFVLWFVLCLKWVHNILLCSILLYSTNKQNNISIALYIQDNTFIHTESKTLTNSSDVEKSFSVKRVDKLHCIWITSLPIAMSITKDKMGEMAHICDTSLQVTELLLPEILSLHP